ncbi:MAG: LOG family protein [Syntrophales bacterium]|nr:LOG family protein [Syntrophales bacterium]
MSITIKRKPPIVGVMGGSDIKGNLLQEAYLLGEGIAKRGYVLLTGGGPGVMRAASEGAWRAGGLVIAILPNDRTHPMRGYPNEFVDIPIYTGLMDARNVINVKTPHVVVIMPGGPGTFSELALALKAGTPVVGLHISPPDFIKGNLYYTHVKSVEEALVSVDKLLTTSKIEDYPPPFVG